MRPSPLIQKVLDAIDRAGPPVAAVADAPVVAAEAPGGAAPAQAPGASGPAAPARPVVLTTQVSVQVPVPRTPLPPSNRAGR